MKKEKNDIIVKKAGQSKMIAGAAALTAIIAIAGIAASTYAYRGDFKEGEQGFGSEKHLAMVTAFENNDYEAWLALTGDKPGTDKITAENFSKFAEMHNLMKEGKFEEAKLIRDELGINWMGKSGNRSEGRGMIEKNKAARTAIESNDYNAWLEAVPENCPAMELVTEENFSKLVESHNLMKEGKFEEAKVLREELGLKARGEGKGIHKFNK